MRKKSVEIKDNVHIGLNIPKDLWEKFTDVAKAYEDLPTHSVLRMLRKAVEEHHIHGFAKKQPPK